jgi:cyclopropane fatty-acyl-phospholipid synthase-like methyltransferase
MSTMTDIECYHAGSDFQFEHGEIPLGAPSSYSLTHDPKHITFVLSRYKFVAKMLEGKQHVMEVGSGDGMGLPIVAKAVGRVSCVDWDERHIASIKRRLLPHFPNISLHHHDLNASAVNLKVDAIYSIDVLEHVDPTKEATFMDRMVSCLPNNGVMITGTPNISASQYASECSAVQHINLKSQKTLRDLMERYFENVFIFGMNDEVLHTGYGPMSHYIWSVASGLKKRHA